MIPRTDGYGAPSSNRAPSETWILSNGAAGGRRGGAEALKQAIYLILNTERCRHLIYSRDYGAEFESLFGQSHSFVKPELERRIRDALSRDDRVLGADGFTFAPERGALRCTFTVRSVYGDLEVEKRV